jgi:hypothetical protein
LLPGPIIVQKPGDGTHPLRRLIVRSNLAKVHIFESIEMFHNRTRRHGHLGGVSSEVFESASDRCL